MTVTNEYYTKGTIEYTTGKYSGNFEYGSVSGLNNLKKESDVAKLNVGKDTATKNRPAKLTLRKFGISLPTGAEISSVVVEYAHRKVKGSNQNKAPNVLAPTISLVGFGSGKNPSKTGVAPTTSMKNRSVTFNFKPTKQQVESENFGVHINYPKNKNDASGYIELKYIRIKINYIAPKYQVTIVPSKKNISVGDSNDIIVSIGNLNGTNYKPQIPISLDSGVTFEKVIEGNISSSNNSVIWKPQVSNTWRGVNGQFRVYCSTSGTKTISLSFTLNGVTYSSTCSFTVNPPSAPETTQNSEDEPNKASTSDSIRVNSTVVKDVPFEIKIQLTPEQYSSSDPIDIIYIYGGENLNESLEDFEFYDSEGRNLEEYDDLRDLVTEDKFNLRENNKAIYIPIKLLDENTYSYTVKVIPKNITHQVLTVGFIDYTDNGDFHKSYFTYDVMPTEDTLNLPILSLIKIDDSEELARLGDDIQYTVKTFLKETTEESYVADWLKNFRLGVFNNAIESNILQRLDYTSIDNKVTININTDDIEEASNYKLILNPSEEIYLERNHDELSGDVEYEIIAPNDEHILSIYNNELKLKCDTDSFNLHAKIINNNDDTIYWEQKYHVSLNNQTEEIKETIIDSTDYNNLTVEEIFYNAEWSSALSAPNVFEEKTVEFNYNENYPLYILITGDYLEGKPLERQLSFKYPILYETGSLEAYDSQIYLPTPIRNILDLGELATLEIPSGKTSNPFCLYDFDIGDVFATGDSMAVRGLIFSMNIDYSDDLILTAKLISPEGKIGTRSIVINGFDSTENAEAIDNQIIIGGSFDLWRFKISEMTNLDEWRLVIEVDNPYLNDDGVGTLIFSDVQLSFYYITFQNDLIIMKVNGEDSRYYGMFIQNVTLPQGLKSDVKYSEIDGSDINKAYRMNIDKKEIEVEFTVDGCTIFETTELLKDIAKLLVNKRNKLNEPILNRFEFNNYPGEHWDCILEDPIDTDVESVNFDSKIKLTVPDGTSWANEDTVTSVNGYNNSITGVNPLIEISPVDNFVELTETITGQTFTLKYDNYLEGDVIIIDCVNRIVTLKQYNSELEKYVEYDISEKADYNVDWFILPVGEFAFDTHGTCSRCTVTFTERG